MTVSKIDPVNNYTGNSSTTTFDYDFLIEEENELLVQHTNYLGVQTTLTLNIDYTIGGVGNENGGSVTFPKGGSSYGVLSSDEILSITPKLDIDQEKEYKNSSKLNLITLEWSLDYITRLIQVLNRKIERSVKVQEGSSMTADELVESLQQAQVNANNSANAAEQSAIEAANQAELATTKTDEVKEAYNIAMDDIGALKTDANNDIAMGRANIASDLVAAISEITTGHNEAINDIATGITKIETTKIEALNKIKETGYGIPPSNCLGLRVDRQGTVVSLSWKDPDDTIIDGQVLSSWSGTKIVRQEGRHPLSIEDGVLIANCTSRNAFEYDALVDFVPDETKTYYYTAFPYSIYGAINLERHNRFGVIIYGYKKSLTNANPATRIEYIEDNQFFRSAYMDYSKNVFNYGDWQNAWFIKNLRPVMLNYNGTIAYELDKNDYTLKKDGTASDVKNTAFGGNAMVGFPTIWKSYEIVGTTVNVRFANVKVDDTYHAYAHTNRLGEVLNEIFLPCYEGSYISAKTRSLSGQGIGNSIAFTTERTYAKANGADWDMTSLADWLLIQDLLTLIGKSTDSQTVFGNGHYAGGTGAGHLIVSGSMDKKGMFTGTNGTWSGVKLFGIENPYGNIWKRIVGWANVNGTQKIKMTPDTSDGSTATDFNLTGEGYISIGQSPSGTSGGYISSMPAIAPYGFFPKEANGSATTYECDGFWFNNAGTMIALVGGACDSGLLVGAFYSSLNNPASLASWYFGSTLSCKPSG